MLILRRNLGEAIVLNEDIVIRIIAIQGDRIKLGIEAPTDVIIRREELCFQHPQAFWIHQSDMQLTDVTPPRQPRAQRVYESSFIGKLKPWQEPQHPDAELTLPE